MNEFDSFYNQSYKSVFRFFYYKGIPKQECEELMQESFIRLIHGYSELLKQDIVRTRKILNGICSNLWKDWLQAHKRSLSVSLDIIEEFLGSEDDSLDVFQDDDFDKQMKSRKLQLMNAIEKLNPNIKKVITLKFLSNYTRSEIAREMSIPEDQVHTYQKRGLKYLRKLINCTPEEYIDGNESEK